MLTLCHALPRTSDRCCDSDRHNLLLTAMLIENTSHWDHLYFMISWSFTQFLLYSDTETSVWFVDASDYAQQRKAETVYKSK